MFLQGSIFNRIFFQHLAYATLATKKTVCQHWCTNLIRVLQTDMQACVGWFLLFSMQLQIRAGILEIAVEALLRFWSFLFAEVPTKKKKKNTNCISFTEIQTWQVCWPVCRFCYKMPSEPPGGRGHLCNICTYCILAPTKCSQKCVFTEWLRFRKM